MSEAASDPGQEFEVDEYFHESLVFDEAKVVADFLGSYIFDTYAEAVQESGELIDELNELAVESGLIGQPVVLSSTELHMPVVKLDPSSGDALVGSGLMQPDGPDGTAETAGEFRGFSHSISAAPYEGAIIPGFIARVCYRVYPGIKTQLPHIDGGRLCAFSPVGVSEVEFASDSARENLERLLDLVHFEEAFTLQKINALLSSGKRLYPDVLNEVGEQVRLLLDALQQAYDDDDYVTAAKDAISNLIKAKLGFARSKMLSVKTDQTIIRHPATADNPADFNIAGNGSLVAPAMDIGFSLRIFKKNGGLVCEEAGREHVPCFIFSDMTQPGQDRVLYIPLDAITELQLVP